MTTDFQRKINEDILSKFAADWGVTVEEARQKIRNLMSEGTLSAPENLVKLGQSHTLYSYDRISPELLECFPCPDQGKNAELEIEIVAPEFTSLCPKTGQPDFATIVVKYTPRTKCVESKSFKLYLGSFRNVGEFHEACVTKISNDLVELLDPFTLVVEGQFTPRGGIKFWPRVSYLSDDWEGF